MSWVQAYDLWWWVELGTDDALGPSDHEAGLVIAARAMLPDGGTFVDVGAHVGGYSLRLARRAGKVVAVEPNPMTYGTLEKNVKRNRLENVRLIEAVAWWRSREKVMLYDANGLESGGSTGAIPIGEARPVAVARAWTLDDLLAEEPRVDVVKIDVEGAELNVLRGAQGVLVKFRPRLMIEMHDAYLPEGENNGARVRGFLESAGYEIDPPVPYGGGYHLLCAPREET